MDEPDAFRGTAAEDIPVANTEGIERVMPLGKPSDRWSDMVVLEKTPERMRHRRIAIALSVVQTVVLLAVTYLWNFDFLCQFRYNIGIPIQDIEMEMTILDSAEASGSTAVLVLVALTTIFTILGLLSPYIMGIGNILFLMAACMSFLPFDIDVGLSPYVCSAMLDQIYVVAAVFVILLVLSYIAMVSVNRSVSISGKVLDRRVGITPRNLLLYNVTKDWNTVARRSG